MFSFFFHYTDLGTQLSLKTIKVSQPIIQLKTLTQTKKIPVVLIPEFLN